MPPRPVGERFAHILRRPGKELIHAAADRRRVERTDHRLDGPDRRWRDRDVLGAEADQCHGFKRAAGHLAANTYRDVRSARLVEDTLEEAQDRGTQPIIALGEAWIGTVSREQELSQ